MFFYSYIIKHVNIFQGVIWHVQQNDVKCFMIPLPQFSYIYWLIDFNVYLIIVIYFMNFINFHFIFDFFSSSA